MRPWVVEGHVQTDTAAEEGRVPPPSRASGSASNVTLWASGPREAPAARGPHPQAFDGRPPGTPAPRSAAAPERSGQPRPAGGAQAEAAKKTEDEALPYAAPG